MTRAKHWGKHLGLRIEKENIPQTIYSTQKKWALKIKMSMNVLLLIFGITDKAKYITALSEADSQSLIKERANTL